MAADDVVPAQEFVAGFGLLAVKAGVNVPDRGARAVILALAHADRGPVEGCLLGGFAHRETNARGNGHASAVFVWDVRSGDRVAMLPCPRRGRRAGAIDAVHSEGARVLAAAEGHITAFDIRMGRLLGPSRRVIPNATDPIVIDLSFSARAVVAATHQMLAPEFGQNIYGGAHEAFDVHVAPVV